VLKRACALASVFVLAFVVLPHGQTRSVKALVGGTLVDGNASHPIRTASSSSTANASRPSNRSARRARFQLCGDVIVKRQRRAHILMR
jgi:hypothetical protein